MCEINVATCEVEMGELSQITYFSNSIQWALPIKYFAKANGIKFIMMNWYPYLVIVAKTVAIMCLFCEKNVVLANFLVIFG